MPYKQSNWTVHLSVDGTDMGYWAVKEGGGVSSEDSSYADHDGVVRLGGNRSRDDITLRKLYREQVHANYRWLDARVGSGQCVVTIAPTRDDGVSWGDPITPTGILGACNPPNVDKSSSDGGELEIVVQANVDLA